MSTGTTVLLVVAAGTYGWKAAGPLLLGTRTLPVRVEAIMGIMPGALLAALVVTATVADGRRWSFDARIVGISAAIIALSAKRGFVTVVVVAALSTAVARAAGLP
jgi:uncharacterized membrane protein